MDLGNNTYDFRLKQSTYTEALAIYKKMMDKLDEERQNQEDELNNWDDWWKSSAATLAHDKTRAYLEKGRYNEAYLQVKGMHDFMEASLPEIKTLLSTSKTFASQLRSDGYVEPIAVTGDAVINGGDLSLNYDAVSVVCNGCDLVVEQITSLESDMQQVMSSVSDILPGVSACIGSLSHASRKLKRVENYKTAVQAYANGINSLDYDISLKMAELEDGTLTWEETEGAKNHKNEIAATMGFLKEESDIQAILNKNPEDWTDEECDAIVKAIGDAFENNDKEMLETITENLVCIGNIQDFVTQADDPYSHIHAEFQGSIMGDREKIAALLACVDKYDNPEVTAYLSEMSRFQIEVDPCLLSYYAPNMADFMATPGLTYYEGDLIDSCVIFDKYGNMSMYIRPCPDGVGADFRPEQQIYAILISEGVFASGNQSTQNPGIEEKEYGDLLSNTNTTYIGLMSSLSEGDQGAFAELFGIAGNHAISEVSDMVTDKVKDFIFGAALEAMGPIEFVIDQCTSISEEMGIWAAENQEELREFLHNALLIYNDNIEETAELLNMNIVQTYSGELQGITMEDWQMLNTENIAMVEYDEWTATYGYNQSAELLPMVYLGLFEGDGVDESTEVKVDAINKELSEILNSKDAKYDEDIAILTEWLEENNEDVEELTFEDYLDMDRDTIDAVKRLREAIKN